jgi:hypothetical protein
MIKRVAMAGVVALCVSAACGGQAVPESGSGSTSGDTSKDVGATSTTGSTGVAAPSESKGVANPTPACVAGRSIGCACTTGESGAQLCKSDGTYGACVCERDGGAPPEASLLTPSECPCTRRPGLGNSFRCPSGAGQSASLTIGTAGGKITLNGQQVSQTGVPFSITVPPGALDADTMITITETATPPPATFTDYSPIYLAEPMGLATMIPLPIVIGWANKDGSVDRSLAIYAGPDVSGPFERLPDSYVNAGFMQGSIKHFGAFFAGYPKTPSETSCP